MAAQRTPVMGPWNGLITDKAPTLDPKGFETFENWLVRKGKIVSRPGFDSTFRLQAPDGNTILNMQSFIDAENFYHTVAWTFANIYMITKAGGVYTFNLLTNPTYIVTVSITPGNGGLNYTEGDINTIQQGPAFGGTFQIIAVDGSGAATIIQLDGKGSQYVNGTNLPSTTTGNGTGLLVDITTATLAGLAGAGSTALPYALQPTQNKIYFCNGSVPLCYTDGEASYKIAGDVPGACRFLTENAGHLIGAVWTEPDPTQSQPFFYPQRIRWSDSNDFNSWDEADFSKTAGVDDLTEVPDQITGLSTLGTNSYIYRNNGISIMSPTGQASQPFYIRNSTTSPKGEGNQYPYSLTSHNNIDRFIGNYEVWAFDGTNYIPLMDSKCNAQFFESLAQVQGTVRGSLTTVFARGYTYLAYVITLPGTGTAYALNIPENTWSILRWGAPTLGQAGFFDLQFIEEVYV